MNSDFDGVDRNSLSDNCAPAELFFVGRYTHAGFVQLPDYLPLKQAPPLKNP